MKRLKSIYAFLVVILMHISSNVAAQNLQLHYDFGRKIVTTTVEMFKPDSAGSTYFFVDMDYSPKVIGAYWEIARELCFWQDSKVNWLSVHLEYNGGLSTETSFNNAFLGGLTYSGHSSDWSKTWSLSLMYKVMPGAVGLNGAPQIHSFQITGVWVLYFFDHWLSFDGCFDFWREAQPWLGTEYIFAAEPQLWVNLNNIKGWEKIKLSLGTEVELSYNFVGKGLYAMPTAAAKWTF